MPVECTVFRFLVYFVVLSMRFGHYNFSKATIIIIHTQNCFAEESRKSSLQHKRPGKVADKDADNVNDNVKKVRHFASETKEKSCHFEEIY